MAINVHPRALEVSCFVDLDDEDLIPTKTTSGKPKRYDHQQVYTNILPSEQIPKTTKRYDASDHNKHDSDLSRPFHIVENTIAAPYNDGKTWKNRIESKSESLDDKSILQYELDMQRSYLECYRNIEKLRNGKFSYQHERGENKIYKRTLEMSSSSSINDERPRYEMDLRMNREKYNDWKSEFAKRKYARRKIIEPYRRKYNMDESRNNKDRMEKCPRKIMEKYAIQEPDREKRNRYYDKYNERDKWTMTDNNIQNVEVDDTLEYDMKEDYRCERHRESSRTLTEQDKHPATFSSYSWNGASDKQLSIKSPRMPTPPRDISERPDDVNTNRRSWSRHIKKIQEKITSYCPSVNGDYFENASTPLGNTIRSVTKSLVSGIKQISSYIPEVEIQRYCSQCSYCCCDCGNSAYESAPCTRCNCSPAVTECEGYTFPPRRCFNHHRFINCLCAHEENVPNCCVPLNHHQVYFPWNQNQPQNNYFIVCESKCLSRILHVLDSRKGIQSKTNLHKCKSVNPPKSVTAKTTICDGGVRASTRHLKNNDESSYKEYCDARKDQHNQRARNKVEPTTRDNRKRSTFSTAECPSSVTEHSDDVKIQKLVFPCPDTHEPAIRKPKKNIDAVKNGTSSSRHASVVHKPIKLVDADDHDVGRHRKRPKAKNTNEHNRKILKRFEEHVEQAKKRSGIQGSQKDKTSSSVRCVINFQ